MLNNIRFNDDKMIAMSGLVELFQHATGDDYIAGLWSSHILEGLKFYVAGQQRQHPLSTAVLLGLGL